jgi:hypothetical protein
VKPGETRRVTFQQIAGWRCVPSSSVVRKTALFFFP